MKKARVKQPIVIPEACGKRRYRSERDAIGSALCCSRKRGTALRVYTCPKCKGWHLTKQTKRRLTEPRAASPATDVVDPAKKPLFNAVGHQIWCECTTCAWLSDDAA